MIIISQDKQHVINSDNVKDFCISYIMEASSNLLEEDTLSKVLIEADGVPIAEYDTEKEAMDILNELSAMIVAGNKDYVIK